jgi:uncharacterized protein (TIGR02147 family)
MVDLSAIPDVFSFDDYRDFLKTWYTQTKSARRSLTYRSFAAKAGFKTSNFLMLVIQGKRNLTEKSIIKMGKGLGLGKREVEFFRDLVLFNQAKTADEKHQYYERVIQSKRYQAAKPIERQQYEYYANWYNPVIRELVCSPDFDGTPDWLAMHLNPQVTRAQCAKSLALLEKLGMVTQDAEGHWHQNTPLVSSGEGLRSLIVHNYHKSILELARIVMDRLPVSRRETSTMTIGIKREDVETIRDKIRTFRKEILQMASNVDAPDEVAQMSIQFFPLTKDRSRRD